MASRATDSANYNYLVNPSPRGGELLRFGTFEINGATGELRRNGSVVRLQPQPFRVLLLLARNPGEIVDRDRLRREIWGGTTVAGMGQWSNGGGLRRTVV